MSPFNSPSDAPVLSCQDPSQGTFVTAVCADACKARVPQKQTVFVSCTAPKEGEFVKSVCVPGAQNMVGSDTVIAKCHAPVGEGVTAACVPGNFNTPGIDSITAPCTGGTYQHTHSSID